MVGHLKLLPLWKIITRQVLKPDPQGLSLGKADARLLFQALGVPVTIRALLCISM